LYRASTAGRIRGAQRPRQQLEQQRRRAARRARLVPHQVVGNQQRVAPQPAALELGVHPFLQPAGGRPGGEKQQEKNAD
jgi:hypothetical protein